MHTRIIALAAALVGISYATGEGVPPGRRRGGPRYRLAADQGLAWAQVDLGNMYATGDGVPEDDVQAYMWYDLAASRQTGEDRELSVEARDAVARSMTSAQLAEAQRLAREWDEAHPPEP